jgi:hypothetical protein
MINSCKSILTQIEDLLKKLEALSPLRESIEWYLINNLRQATEEIMRATKTDELRRTEYWLRQFALDTLEPKSALKAEVYSISSAIGHVARTEK